MRKITFKKKTLNRVRKGGKFVDFNNRRWIEVNPKDILVFRFGDSLIFRPKDSPEIKSKNICTFCGEELNHD